MISSNFEVGGHFFRICESEGTSNTIERKFQGYSSNFEILCAKTMVKLSVWFPRTMSAAERSDIVVAHSGCEQGSRHFVHTNISTLRQV